MDTKAATGTFLPRAKGHYFRMTITDEQKRTIDAWVKKNGRNEYGDKPDTHYAGGNPLFDEMSPKLKDRYEYILERNPELKTEIETPQGK
ncbi:MAG: hypothetical protein H7Y38_02815 [Armatimonadetes bacterium]|nr:hypothetical protein [Armatimonadota bacterium]